LIFIKYKLAKSHSKEIKLEEEYWAVCEVCDTETQVMVVNSEDYPAFCPMCGSDLEFDPVEE
jgi:hypothetical protein